MFTHQLQSEHPELVEQVIWGFGNIAGDGAWARDLVLQSGAAEIMAAKLLACSEVGTAFVRNCSWTLSNLCRGKPCAKIDLVSVCIPALAKCLI